MADGDQTPDPANPEETAASGPDMPGGDASSLQPPGSPPGAARGTELGPPPSLPEPPGAAGAAGTPRLAVRRSPAFLLTWLTVGIVLIIVVGLVVVKVVRSQPSPPPGRSEGPAAPDVVQALTAIPPSVYDTVGAGTSDDQLTAPVIVGGQPALTFGGKPGVLFVGGEYCAYCAAERWPLIAALSRFGTFTNLGAMQSSANDVFPSTASFTFYDARYSSRFVSVRLVERWSDQPDARTGFTVIQPLTRTERDIVATYNTARYLGPGAGPGQVPFVDVGNKAVVSGSAFSPTVLAGLDRTTIAGNLDDPASPPTQDIVAAANDLTAAICSTTDQRPGAVCSSRGVREAAQATKIGS